jgi:hypothetical protein
MTAFSMQSKQAAPADSACKAGHSRKGVSTVCMKCGAAEEAAAAWGLTEQMGARVRRSRVELMVGVDIC